MKDLKFNERIKKASQNYMRLMANLAFCDIEDSKKKVIVDLLDNLYNEQIDLICLLNSNEVKKEDFEIQIPDFVQGKRA